MDISCLVDLAIRVPRGFIPGKYHPVCTDRDALSVIVVRPRNVHSRHLTTQSCSVRCTLIWYCNKHDAEDTI